MIAIVIVNWNGWRDTVECLESLMRLEMDGFRVIVVDNGSSDGSVEAIRDWAAAPERAVPQGPPWAMLPAARRLVPEVRVVRPEAVAGGAQAGGEKSGGAAAQIMLLAAGVNLGFAGANNLGMRLALAQPDTRFVWLLNNDTVVAPDSLSRLVEGATREPQVGLWGNRLMFYHAPDRVQGLAGRFRAGRCSALHLGVWQKVEDMPERAEVEAQMTYVIGASMFLSRAFLETVGLMSESYFLYFEELDWAARIRGRFRQGVCMEAVVYHKEGGSIGADPSGRLSDTGLYYLTVNLFRFVWTHRPLLLAFAFGRFLRQGVRHLRRRDGRALQVMGLALRDFLTGRRRTGPIRMGR